MTSLQSHSPSPLDTNPSKVATPNQWKIKLLYDGDCPLCLREVDFLRRKDAGRGLVALVDIADPNYCSEDNGGVSFDAAMGRIHAILPDGTVIKNVEVFRQVYAVLGIGWLYAPTKWPGLGWLVDKVYDFWADRRLAWTGRPSLEELIAQRHSRPQADRSQGCGPDPQGNSNNRCRVD